MSTEIADPESALFLDQIAKGLAWASRMEASRAQRLLGSQREQTRELRLAADAIAQRGRDLGRAAGWLIEAYAAGHNSALTQDQARQLLEGLKFGERGPASAIDDPHLNPNPDADRMLLYARGRPTKDPVRIDIRGLVSTRPIAMQSAADRTPVIEQNHPDGPGARLQSTGDWRGFKTLGRGHASTGGRDNTGTDQMHAAERNFESAMRRMGEPDGPGIRLAILPLSPGDAEFITGVRTDNLRTISFEVVPSDPYLHMGPDKKVGNTWRGYMVVTDDQSYLLERLFRGDFNDTDEHPLLTRERAAGPEAVAELIDAVGERIFGHQQWHFGAGGNPPAGPQFWKWDPDSAKTRIATTFTTVARKVDAGRNWLGWNVGRSSGRTRNEDRPNVGEAERFPVVERPPRERSQGYTSPTEPYPENGRIWNWRPRQPGRDKYNPRTGFRLPRIKELALRRLWDRERREAERAGDRQGGQADRQSPGSPRPTRVQPTDQREGERSSRDPRDERPGPADDRQAPRSRDDRDEPEDTERRPTSRRARDPLRLRPRLIDRHSMDRDPTVGRDGRDGPAPPPARGGRGF